MSTTIERQQEQLEEQQRAGGEENAEEQEQRIGEKIEKKFSAERERDRLATEEQVRQLVAQLASEQVAAVLKEKTVKDIFGNQLRSLEEQQNESANKLLDSARSELERLTSEFSRRLQSAGSSVSDEIYSKFDGLSSKFTEDRKSVLEELRAERQEFLDRAGRALEQLRTEKNEVAAMRDQIDSFLGEIHAAKGTLASTKANRDRCEEILTQVQQISSSKAQKKKEKEKEQAHISVEERSIAPSVSDDVRSLVEATKILESNYSLSQTRLEQVQNTVDSLHKRISTLESNKPQPIPAAAPTTVVTKRTTARLLLEDHAKTLLLALIAFIMMAQLLTQNRPEYPNGYI